MNHFPNIGLLTTKTGLLDSLRELSRSKTMAARCSGRSIRLCGIQWAGSQAVWGTVGGVQWAGSQAV